MSYRKASFFRLKAGNEQRIAAAMASGRVRVFFASEVARIAGDHVDLQLGASAQGKIGRLANDDVFVLAGGTPPFPLLQSAGVSFDPALRPPARAKDRNDGSLLTALVAALAGASALLAFRRVAQ